MLTTLYTYFLEPLRETAALTQCRRSTKKAKRNLSKAYRQYQRYGLVETVQKKAQEIYQSISKEGGPNEQAYALYNHDMEGRAASFITDQ